MADEPPDWHRPPAPGGRPRKTPEMREAESLAKAHSVEMVKRLVEIAMNSDDEKAAIIAADKVLDRAFGRPAQAITGPEGEPLQLGLSPSDVRRELEGMLRRLRAPVVVADAQVVVALPAGEGEKK